MRSVRQTNICAPRIDGRPWRLVIPHAAWAGALRRLLIEPGTRAVGSVRLNPTPSSRELLVDALDISSDVPNGAHRPTLDACCVVDVDQQASAVTTADQSEPVARRFEAQSYQLLAWLRHSLTDRANWHGEIWTGDHCEPLDEVCLPGRLGLRLRASAAGATPGAPEPRWSRTTGALGTEVLSRLRSSTVTLIGAGRNGTAAAFQLAALGIGRLRLIDPDRLRVENLDAMPGVAAQDVDRTKVQALARGLRQFRPDLHVTLVDRSVKDVLAAHWLQERADLIVTCVDDDLPRLAATIVAARTLMVHLDIGTSVQRSGDELSMTGDARLFLPREGCCACVPGMARIEEVFYDLRSSDRALPRRPRPTWDRQRAGSLVTINGLAVSCGIQLWLDLLTGRLGNSYWQRLEWSHNGGLIGDGATVSAARSCRWCGSVF